ncbi:nime/cyclinb [Coprinopsis cinerea okayama7|uniref:Nime/cyclinb n=1 Tax=Coprinopsis cinerea (strain Okayama-7 / 130 / ATCC MYA-4618 / FGSC 9003) TaxID=240176 RepID=A8PCK1_COPC7|nr:nime/cyclinb [Coprinopsis cinerea okayama7\|eukprot:XP_001840419.2 nime/cyclinb [Coprinopsis cinerea okayama7\
MSSSNLPVRRTTLRTTRTMKDTENATARATRATVRGKVAGATTAVTSRVTAPTVASKAKAVSTDAEGNVGKRKRGALVEVTGVNKNSTHTTAAKGKEAAPTKPTTGATQRVLRRAPASSTAARTAKVAESAAIKKKESSKPPSRTLAPKVYRDDAPVEEQAPADDDEADVERVSKRRHMEAVPEDTSQRDAERVARDLVAAAKEEEIAVDQQETFEPEPQLWEDLDADDWDDPLMVSEYVHDVCAYWKKTELATLPKANYMEGQQELTWDHRGILIDWILQVHARFNLLPESLFLTVNLLDRFLSARPISLNKLQLVGLACFFIASKFEETCAPSVNEIVFLADNQYTVAEVLKAEMYILRVLDWDLSCPGPMSWLRRGSKADECESTARTVAKYLLEIGCLEHRLVGIVPSHMAAAALWLGRLAVGREEWTPTLEHYTTFTEKEILPVATIMLEYIITNPIQHESLYKKYAHKRYLKCSAYMRQWALERWPENSDVHLKRDLKRIKAEIRQHNEELAAEAAAEAVRPAH